MIRNTLFLLLAINLSCTTKKDNITKYDEFFYQAMLEYKNNKYEKSIEDFEKALKYKSNESVQPYFYAAATALQLNDEERAKDLIISGIENTNPEQDYFNSFDEFDEFKDQKLFQKVNENYRNYTANFYKNLKNPKIYKELDSLQIIDQEVRTNRASKEERMHVDSTNIARLKEITEKYGWQKQGWILLWHQRGTYKEDNWIWNYFKPVINKNIKEGKLRKSFWAQFEEFQNVIENGNQEYGLYPQNFSDYPLINPKKVDSKRDSVNLPPLWVMNEIYGWPLPDNYNKNYSL